MAVSASVKREQALSQAISHMDMARQELCKIKLKQWEWGITDAYILLDNAQFILDNMDEDKRGNQRLS